MGTKPNNRSTNRDNWILKPSHQSGWIQLVERMCTYVASHTAPGVWIGAALIVAPLMLAGLAPLAAAHDVVMRATPEDKSVVEEFPHRVVLEFSGIPKPNFNTLAISNADTKEILFTGQPELDKQFVSINIPEDINPGPGNYIVGFQITSSDGHSTRGKTTFSVGDPQAAQSATAEGSQQAQQQVAEESGEGPVWVWIAGAVVLLAAISGAGLLLTRK